jgi:hypothetical protein
MNNNAQAVHIFGFRHHGPGSARSLGQALERLAPDIILVEGPPDAQAVLPLLAHAEMQPPVALLIYAPDEPKRATFFPFASFSPEWQALQYAFRRQIPARFIDLPQAYQLKLAEESEQTPPDDPEADLRQDPLGALAQAAGYPDGEQWWETMVEHRRNSHDLFAAILEAMTALREQFSPDPDRHNLLREAYMRQEIRAAQKEGFARIGVVCGAWHAPALLPSAFPPASHDSALLKGLAKVQVSATWIPWTHSRLTRASGYGAGIHSPGWYQHLWEDRTDVAAGWLAKVARLLRAEDIDASTAQVIDAVRLAQTLAALRERSLPGLQEFNEAALAVFCFGNDKPMQLIREKLIVGEIMGAVPGETPLVPLQRNLEQEQKRLRMQAEAGETILKLDLRKPFHLERSHLLNRLQLLGIHWGRKERLSGQQQGTFHEVWRLRWYPELTIQLIEGSAWGNTVEDAAGAYACHAAAEIADLRALTELVNSVLLADLPAAVDQVVRRLQALAALTGDISLLMRSLPPLADVLAYGNVRKTDASMAGAVADGMVTRVCIGLPAACASLADDAAQEMFNLMLGFNHAIRLLADPAHQEGWLEALARLLERPGVHGLIRGRSCRLLFDSGRLSLAEATRQMRLALSTVEEPVQIAAWLTGFLQGSGLILLHHPTLLQIIDEWVMSLSGEDFVALLPLLRRTFTTFTEPERKQIGQMIKRQAGPQPERVEPGDLGQIDEQRARAMLPIIAELLGLKYQEDVTDG